MKKFWLVLSSIGILFMSMVVPISADEFTGIEQESDIPQWYQEYVIERGNDYVIFKFDGVVYAGHGKPWANGKSQIRITGDVPNRELLWSTTYKYEDGKWVVGYKNLPPEIRSYVSSGESGNLIKIDELIPFGRFEFMYSNIDVKHKNDVVFHQAPVVNTAVQRKLATEKAVKEMGADFGMDSSVVLKSSLIIFGALLAVSLVPRTIRRFVG